MVYVVDFEVWIVVFDELVEGFVGFVERYWYEVFEDGW